MTLGYLHSYYRMDGKIIPLVLLRTDSHLKYKEMYLLL